VRFRQAPLDLALVHRVVVAWGDRSLRLVFFAQGSSRRTCGSIICDSSKESKEPIQFKGDKE
jgi:hypothetical protein